MYYNLDNIMEDINDKLKITDEKSIIKVVLLFIFEILFIYYITLSNDEIKDLINVKLYKFFKKNTFAKYILLFIIVNIANEIFNSVVYKKLFNSLQIMSLSFLIIILFYILNNIHYKITLIVLSCILILYLVFNFSKYNII